MANYYEVVAEELSNQLLNSTQQSFKDKAELENTRKQTIIEKYNQINNLNNELSMSSMQLNKLNSVYSLKNNLILYLLIIIFIMTIASLIYKIGYAYKHNQKFRISDITSKLNNY
jgi:hypothetical protein